MENWRDIEVSDWEDFTKIVSETVMPPTARPGTLFRGQPDIQWQLIPKIARVAKELSVTPESLLELEAHALALFQEQCHLYLDVKSLLMDDSLPGWWALMQHYGTPTRLIDWTASPYVGAYFAVRERPGSCGAIWVVGPGAVDAAMLAQFGDYDHSLTSDFQRDFLMPAARGRVHFFWRTRQSERMAAQQGHFSMAEPIIADQAELIWSVLLEEDLRNAFGRILIPAEQKPEFLHHLAQMNINARTLFPGVDGLGRSIAEVITLGLHFGLESNARYSQPPIDGNAELPEKPER